MSQNPASAATLYTIFRNRQQELCALGEEQAELVELLGVDSAQAEGTRLGAVVDGLLERLRADRLRVLVVGRFSSGKTTFINALLSHALLPASPLPTTAVLCDIRYGEEPRAVLYPKKGFGEADDDPVELPPEDLEAALARTVKIRHEGQTSEVSRYRRAEIFWPLALCADGVDLVDSVGLDDPDARDQITLEEAAAADLVVYCMKSLDAFSARDRQVIATLRALGHDSILFLITYYDEIVTSAQLGECTEEDFREQMRKRLAPLTDLGRDGVCFVDSRAALAGRLGGDPARLAASGIAKVEHRLATLLVEGRGRARLRTTLRSLRLVNREVRRLIPQRIALHEATIEQLETRYAQARAPLERLETLRRVMVGEVAVVVQDATREARQMGARYFTELPDRVMAWAEQAEITGGIGFPPRRATLEPIVREVLEHTRSCIEGDLATWSRDTLTPRVASRIDALIERLDEDTRRFTRTLEEVRLRITVGEGVETEALAGANQPSILGRLVAGGLLLGTGDVLTAGVGVTLGLKAMLRTVLLQVTGVLLLIVLGALNPFTFVAAIASAALGGGVWNLASLKKAIRRSVGTRLRDELRLRRSDLIEHTARAIEESLGELRNALDAGLAGEISRIRGEVETVLEEKRRESCDPQDAIRRLRALEARNLQLDERQDKIEEEVQHATDAAA